MCRSKANGGRRCNGQHEDSESYAGTPWQGYDEYQQRADGINRRIYEGETITQIMEADQLAKGQAMIDRINREGW